tara:strand:- start:49 stop:1125 length:1077 start_codon:yes stop_codon:yes gene_type:complete
MKVSIVSLYYNKNIKSGSNLRFEETIKVLLSLNRLNKVIVLNDQIPNFIDKKFVITIENPLKKIKIYRRIFLYNKLNHILNNLPPNIVINDFTPIPLKALNKHIHYQLIHDLRDWNNIRKNLFIKIFKYIQLIQWKQTKRIIAVSNFTKDEIIIKTNKNPFDILVSYNGVEKIPSNVIKFQNRKIDVLCVAPFEERKNHITLIKSLNLLKNNNIFINCQFIGTDRGYLKRIKENIKYYGLDEIITINTNIKSPEKLLNLYNNSKILSFPSIYEGFGIPLIEALSHGTKVVCSNIPPFKEVCKNYASYHDPFDYLELSSLILDELKNPPNALDMQKFVNNNYLWSKNIKEMINLMYKKN